MLKKQEEWLKLRLPLHEDLTSMSQTLLKKLMTERNIDFLSITGRTKDEKSAINKINRKSYENPDNEMTDLSGIRVIVYFESQIGEVSKLIREIFEIDENNSLDQDRLLGEDRIGYRSVHFVCTLGSSREKLAEYQSINNLKFEIQIRTVLQHAWAELAHDGSYKFSGELPKQLQRKLNLYSGMLEVVDQGFDEVAQGIEDYKREIADKGLNSFIDADIDAINLRTLIKQFASQNNIKIKYDPNGWRIDDIIKDLRAFGANTISDASDLLSTKLAEKLSDYSNPIFDDGLFVDAMILKDIDHYFDKCYDPDLEFFQEDIEYYEEVYGKEKITEIAQKYNIVVETEFR